MLYKIYHKPPYGTDNCAMVSETDIPCVTLAKIYRWCTDKAKLLSGGRKLKPGHTYVDWRGPVIDGDVIKGGFMVYEPESANIEVHVNQEDRRLVVGHGNTGGAVEIEDVIPDRWISSDIDQCTPEESYDYFSTEDDHTVAIVDCVIPRRSIYYRNCKGELVSNMLLVKDIKPITKFTKRPARHRFLNKIRKMFKAF